MGELRASLEGARVLIIEDESLIAANLKEMLHELGCVPTAIASSVSAALAAINDGNELDCATLDVRLFNEIAGQVAWALMAKAIPFVICSAYDISLPDFRHIPVVGKPYTKEQIKIGLEKALGIPQAGVAATNSNLLSIVPTEG